MNLYNVLDKLKEIAESNDSEDVANAIETTTKYGLKESIEAALAETEEEIEEAIVDEEDMEEGNEFSGALAAARKAGKDKFTVDGEEYDVKEAIAYGLGDYRDEEDDRYDADGNMVDDYEDEDHGEENHGLSADLDAWMNEDEVEEHCGKGYYEDADDNPFSNWEANQDDEVDSFPTPNYDPERELEEDDMEEGNEFSGALAKARANNADEFEVDGKKYDVKEAEDEFARFESLNKSMNPDTQINEAAMAELTRLDESPVIDLADVKERLKHLWELLQQGLDPETKQAVQNKYIELKAMKQDMEAAAAGA